MEMMKGLVAYPNGDIMLEEVPVPELGNNPYAPHDVLCEVVYCGICGSDIHKWKADKKGVKTSPKKVVVGHEIVSVVKEVGPAVTRVKPGDRVVHEIVTFYCGHCPNCLEGKFNICNTISPMEGRAHFMTGGGFAKYTVWPEWQLHVLPDNITDVEAVLVEPTAGSIHSVISRMGIKAGESVAILGPGARGILMAQVCQAIGAGPIFMTGLERDEAFRLEMAKTMGVDTVINVEKEDLRKIILEKTNGIGVDNVLENTGSVEPIEESLDIVRKGGKVLWAGGGIRGGIVAPVDTYKIIVKEITVYGEISQIPYDWHTALHLLGTGAVQLKPLVTHVFDLDDWEAGFDLAATCSECLRVAIKP
ncbi:zinc-dependent alcohol dehydrogenase [Acidaminobacter hydrogenoformans]|uniref:L-iditol 2-dehydrogenase n=1 Tax=Acidaminobacter hydrogenoformans DSM 2784 TaxID=1120920 RepID=A0A1G5RVQ6_9FIRM|nr:alcohol dehydrogenase catalytic domain-containing protein [Acidaminobacter hydrogenoformans]SCZ78192.1 L-iditol 2-dehydrogenase [Acidaminobacter hydrogenoformans DSM 2784]